MEQIINLLARAAMIARREGEVDVQAVLEGLVDSLEAGADLGAYVDYANLGGQPAPAAAPAAPVTVTATAEFTRTDGERMPFGALETIKEFSGQQLAHRLTADVDFPSAQFDGPTATVEMVVTGRPGQDAGYIAGLLRDWGGPATIPGAEDVGRVFARIVELDIPDEDVRDVRPEGDATPGDYAPAFADDEVDEFGDPINY